MQYLRDLAGDRVYWDAQKALGTVRRDVAGHLSKKGFEDAVSAIWLCHRAYWDAQKALQAGGRAVAGPLSKEAFADAVSAELQAHDLLMCS